MQVNGKPYQPRKRDEGVVASIFMKETKATTPSESYIKRNYALYTKRSKESNL
jgi:hypothetical protein